MSLILPPPGAAPLYRAPVYDDDDAVRWNVDRGETNATAGSGVPPTEHDTIRPGKP